MDEKFINMYNILSDAILECDSKCISLSGGLDSSILAYLLQKKNISAVCIISKESPGNDLTFSQMIAKKFSIPIKIKIVDIDELLFAVNETIKILKVFNDIEIRNAVVMYLSLQTVKKNVMVLHGAWHIAAGVTVVIVNCLVPHPDHPVQKITRSLSLGLELRRLIN